MFAWLNNDQDSFGWLELCFTADEELILDKLYGLDSEIAWESVLDEFISAEFEDETVTFTVHSNYPFPLPYIAKCLDRAFFRAFGVLVQFNIVREAS